MGSPDGLTSDAGTASFDRFHVVRSCAYWPFLMRWLMASATGAANPLSFFAVSAISPWRKPPAPENEPASGVGSLVLAVWVLC